MSQVAEKARYYLERTVPQLREWEDHGLFTKDEIRAIVKKRNEFEHRVLEPRNQPSAFSAYAAYERALATLLKRRMKRLHVHQLPNGISTAPRAAFVLERGVDRHPSSPHLWREYLAEVAELPNDNDDSKKRTKKRRSTKRWRKAMTRALRLMPTDAGLWIMAGQKAVSEGDWEGARGMFMRGCRFCTGDGDSALWLEFARSEMLWLDRARRKMQNEQKTAAQIAEDEQDADQILFDDDEEDSDQDGDNGQVNFVLPEPGAKAPAQIPEPESAGPAADTPAMNGAIVKSIADVASKQRFFTPIVGRQFFIIFSSFKFSSIPAETTDLLVQGVLDSLLRRWPGEPDTVLCWVLQPVQGIQPTTVEFVRGLREMLQRLWGSAEQRKVREGQEASFGEKMAEVVDEWLGTKGLDPSITLILEDIQTKLGKAKPPPV